MGDLERHVMQLGDVPTPMFDELPAIPVVVWLTSGRDDSATQLRVTNVYVEVGVLNIDVTDDPTTIEILRDPSP